MTEYNNIRFQTRVFSDFPPFPKLCTIRYEDNNVYPSFARAVDEIVVTLRTEKRLPIGRD